MRYFLFSLCCAGVVSAADLSKLPVLFTEDFEKGHGRWETTDAESWTHRKVNSNQVFGINRRSSGSALAYRRSDTPKPSTCHHQPITGDKAGDSSRFAAPRTPHCCAGGAVKAVPVGYRPADSGSGYRRDR